MTSWRLIFIVSCIAFATCGCAGLQRPTPPIFVDPSVTRQVIEVTPSGKGVFTATLTAWLYDKGIWHLKLGPWPAVIGRNGFAALDAKKEGDGHTPSGVYALGLAFGKEIKLHTGLLYRQTLDDDIWVDDPASTDYNHWVKMPSTATSYETMRRQDGLYDLGAVIEYNTRPVIPGNGSAIFLHIWRDKGRKPTAGCVALHHRHLRHLLAWISQDLDPVIALGMAE
ncbi:MAG: L,D-transpeptidase family protein [Candidatus Omnitrophota bacterium]